MDRIWLGVFFLSDWLVLSSCRFRHYHFVDQSLTWTEAQTYCRQTYVDLATVENSEEVDRLINTLSSAGHNSEVWIGLYSKIDWFWSDGLSGSGAEYRNWTTSENEPNFYIADQFCVSVGAGGGWYDDFCPHTHQFICYNGTQQDPEFHLVNLLRSWHGAQTYCRENFTDLAIMRNHTDNQLVQSLVQSGLAWTGLSRHPYFFWSDGNHVNFKNWDDVSNPLNSSSVICGVTSSERSGKWKFWSCETRLPFICHSYPPPVKKQLLKMRMKVGGSVDLKDPDVKAEILKQLQDRLKEDGVSGVTLKWREQPDGGVFHKETEDTEK